MLSIKGKYHQSLVSSPFITVNVAVRIVEKVVKKVDQLALLYIAATNVNDTIIENNLGML